MVEPVDVAILIIVINAIVYNSVPSLVMSEDPVTLEQFCEETFVEEGYADFLVYFQYCLDDPPALTTMYRNPPATRQRH